MREETLNPMQEAIAFGASVQPLTNTTASVAIKVSAVGIAPKLARRKSKSPIAPPKAKTLSVKESVFLSDIFYFNVCSSSEKAAAFGIYTDKDREIRKPQFLHALAAKVAESDLTAGYDML